MPDFLIKSQLPFAEQGGWIDDCGPSSLAMAIAWSSQGARDVSVAASIQAVAMAGRVDRIGKGDPTTFKQLSIAAKSLSAVIKYPKSWAEVMRALDKGAAVIVNVQAPKNYPPQALAANAFAAKQAKAGRDYGHYAVLVKDERGLLFGDPTQSGKGREKRPVAVSPLEAERIARSKGAAPHTKCLIVNVPAAAPAASPKPVQSAPSRLGKAIKTLIRGR